MWIKADGNLYGWFKGERLLENPLLVLQLLQRGSEATSDSGLAALPRVQKSAKKDLVWQKYAGSRQRDTWDILPLASGR